MATLAEQKAALKCWLRFDDENNPLKDTAGNTTWTLNGLTVGSTNAFDSHALQFSGAKSYGYSEFVLGGQDFTIDFWVYAPTRDADWVTIYTGTRRVAGVKEWFGEIYDQFGLHCSNVVGGSGAFDLSYNTLHHIAYVYKHDVGFFAQFIDGTRIRAAIIATNHQITLRSEALFAFGIDAISLFSYTADGSIDENYDPDYFGTQFPSAGTTISEFRVFDGVALWTKDFTPPTAEDYTALANADASDSPTITEDSRVELDGYRVDLLIRSEDSSGNVHRRTIPYWSRSMTEYELIQQAKELTSLTGNTFKNCTYRINRTIKEADSNAEN